ncbi:MAG: Benzoylformate decarboxylase [Alphaproteobacteria bacterium MarineAlpha11_Bin1]|nr:MAG: Benzoylformate decarboxylase [Alphaproteobacteria bacterium MarineAlpha11_Bin1]|tara:strand:+ start:4625 stop:6340 length:1716 start_codon:yes stop_codon:yes gene_type:complete
MKNYMDGGEAIVEAFRRLDIDYVMASPGSEWGSVWEAFARQAKERSKGPEYLSCAHETLAVNLAMGYTAFTGRMQAVMLHTGVGLLQGSMGIDAANRAGLPMVVVSGESQTYSEQGGFEPGPQWHGVLSVVGGPSSLVDRITKWSQPVSSPHTLHEQLIRAGEMAQRSPPGPVYMSIPIETMLHGWTPPQNPRKVPPAPKPAPPSTDIEAVADMLLTSKAPAIVAESIGRDPAGYAATIELADLLAIPVSECRWLDFTNFPKDHPMYQGMGEPEYLHDSDVVLTLRARAPWTPPSAKPAKAKIVNIDETPFRPHMVHQSLQADIFLEGDAVATLKSLVAVIREKGVDAAVVASRFRKWSAAHDNLVAGKKSLEHASLAKNTITPVGLCAMLGNILPDDSVYIDETITHRPIIVRHLAFQGPQSFFSVPSGGLGQGLGLALGTKLAMRDRLVVSVIGDGSFMYNPVVQSLALSKHRDLPVLIVIFNNGGYSAMRKEHHTYYPDGVAAEHNTSVGHTITDLDYSELGSPFGFYGCRVDKLSDLPAALKKARQEVEGGTTAILNVILDDAAGSN